MINELIFVLHSLAISIFALASLWIGKEALVGFISVQCILANLFVVKQTTLFGLTATCSDAYSIGAVLGLNLLQEYFGRDAARRAIWISFFLLFFYVLVSQLHCLYIPGTQDTMHPYFQEILGCMPRIVVASLCVYLVVQFLDSWLFAQLRTLLGGNYLIFRTAFSIASTQLLDTILFSYLGLYGIIDNMWDIIIVSYGIKLLAIAIATPLIGLSRKLIS